MCVLEIWFSNLNQSKNLNLRTLDFLNLNFLFDSSILKYFQNLKKFDHLGFYSMKYCYFSNFDRLYFMIMPFIPIEKRVNEYFKANVYLQNFLFIKSPIRFVLRLNQQFCLSHATDIHF